MARKVGGAVTLVVLAVSGLYLIVYLYRWEWNRAVVAGVFFVAAEVAAVASTVLRRLRSIEDRLAAGPPHEQVLRRLHETAPAPANRFAWLDERLQSTNVFVPVLLGAGVILSLLATGVERLAASSARPQLERRLAGRLDLLALPGGGLLGPAPVDGVAARHPQRLGRLRLDRAAALHGDAQRQLGRARRRPLRT